MADTFGQLLRKLRKENRLTQTELRERLATWGYSVRSKGTISKWENDENKPSEDIVEALADILGVPPTTLLREAGHYVDEPEYSPAQASQGDPLILRRREQHFDRMAAIAHEILTIFSWLEDLRPGPTGEYLHGEGEEIYRISRSEVSDWLQDNVDLLRHQGRYVGLDDMEHEHEAWPRLDLQCFEAHLREEFAEDYDLRSKNFALLVKEDPYELIGKLRILARTKLFKGKCPICQDL